MIFTCPTAQSLMLFVHTTTIKIQ